MAKPSSKINPLEFQEDMLGGPDKEKITPESVKSAVADHVQDRARRLHEKYGSNIDYSVLLKILSDRDAVRFPVTIAFDSSRLEPGMFAVAEPVERKEPEDEEEAEYREYEEAADNFVVVVHEYFKDKLDLLPPMVLYHLVTINYGDMATSNDAEVFGSGVLGMDQEVYYSQLCDLADQITS
ncbi:hypothetical protein MNBD_GAMMA26-465 [hydrothermal vent metagenome]|uniref:Uncharacterized protein n=1 Tax=hydrothermal vent metagenome TaxID=652676 RepID=A0A3B1B8R8_9ZZZZ